MPRARKAPRPPHRPQITINWQQVAELLAAGANGVQIAAVIGCHPDTLYDRVEQEHGVTFTAFSAAKRATGDAALLSVMYRKAVAEGDKTMLIWLSKQRLGMSDKHETSINSAHQPVLLLEGIPVEAFPDLPDAGPAADAA